MKQREEGVRMERQVKNRMMERRKYVDEKGEKGGKQGRVEREVEWWEEENM